MKKVLYPLLATSLLFTAGSTFAAKSGDSQTGKTQVVVQEKHILGDLKMTSKVTITPQMIADAKTQTFQVATFCTYTNRKDGKVSVKITNNERGFRIVGTKGEGNIDYKLTIGKASMKYGINQLTVDANDAPASCKTKETVYMTLTGDAIKNAKAGTYNASFNIAVG